MAILRAKDPVRFHDYDVVHVARTAKGEGGDANRWVVLCDHAKRTSLHDAIVVEVDGKDGRLLAMRRPQ